MSTKLHILVLCGGQSTEHEISILSASNITRFIDLEKYQVSVGYITQQGVWQYFENSEAFFSHKGAPRTIQIIPGQKQPFVVEGAALAIDCIFPITHGTNGEDGTLQGFLELLRVPYVSADCLGSAIAMDKDIAKRLMRDAGIAVVDWRRARKTEAISYAQIRETLGDTLFVKPNSLGSSVGTRKVSDPESFHEALQSAFQLDEFVLIERAIVGREIECSVLGNENLRASLPGEIIRHTEFYSYEAKYISKDAATVKVPAELPAHWIAAIQETAIIACKALRTNGMARVDFFLTEDEELYVNEVNTLPGFTNISMYPKNWEASGLSYARLLDELIQLGLQRFQFKQSLTRVYQPREIGV